MLVRMLVELSGPGMLLAPGDERDFPDAEAVRLIAAEYAVPVAEHRVERAVVAEPATEQRRRGRPRKEI
jgi:hypothetical protein